MDTEVVTKRVNTAFKQNAEAARAQEGRPMTDKLTSQYVRAITPKEKKKRKIKDESVLHI